MKSEAQLKAEIERLQRSVEKQALELDSKIRELEIEAALEKVRSASMAMHKSEELVQVVRILDKAISGLGIEINGTQIIIDFADPENDGYNVWIAVDGQDYLKKFHIPFIKHKHPILKKILTAIQKGTEFYTESYSKTEKNEFFKVLIKNSDFSAIPKERQDYIYSTPGYVRAISLSKNSILIFHRYDLKEFSKEEEEIFKRFGKVFEQAYTRFLDLQKAEAQAREAQIEAALEKVRSASMAMHKSDDLLLVIRAVHEQITELGIKVDASNFLTFIENSRDFYLWAITNTHTYQQKLRVTYMDFGMTKKLWDAWEKGDSFVELQADADEMHRWWNKAFEVSELRHTPPHRREIILSAPGHTSIVARKKTCALQLHRYNLERFTTQEHDILRRLASVFEQSYSRFLDLQKAENQAREAQIEVALEKVRSASMAMHKSEELIQVVRIIDKEIQGLGIETEGTQIITDFAEPDKGFNDWFAKEGHDFLEKFYIPYIEHSLTKKIYDAVAKGVDFYSDSYSKDEKIEFYKMLFEYSDFRTYPKESQDYLFNLPGLVRASVLSKNSILVFQRYDLKEFSKEEEDIFKRFGKVFEQSFVRFLDLQKAEAQAREAIKQSSLDRVRGEIASMRDAKDLKRITPLVWKELQYLGVPFFRCGVMLVNEEEEVIDFYLSNPQGEALAALHLDFENSEITLNGVAHWRKKETYVEHWNQEQFLTFMRGLLDQGQISNPTTYQGGEKPPSALTLQFVPFAQGMLYVGSEIDLNAEELDLVKALGKSLSVAYARYEDFTKLDLAKAKAEKALNDLKAAQEQLVQQEKLASLGQLTAGIAHEIKNPLNFVNNFSEVSMEMIEEIKEERTKSHETRDETLVDEILEDIQSNLGKIHEHGTRANGIVTSMLQHSRGGSGKMEPTDLNALIKEYVNLSFHGMRAGKNPVDVDIQLDLDDSIGKINLIGEDFSQVILNLCNNAFDALKSVKTQRLASLKVRTKKLDDNITIEIEDNGPGIPDDIKDKILQPFFTTKKGTEGTGLGLSITHDIVKAHGGELNVESTEEEGSIFIIQLPKT